MRSGYLLRTCTIALILVSCSHAATVGYWRFENASPSSTRGADSGPNSLNLTNNNTVGSVATPFGTTVPLTGETNTLAASFTRTSSQYFSRVDSASFALQSFTIEAFIRASSFQTGSNVSSIAGQFNNNAANNSAWLFGVTGSGSSLGANELLLQLSLNGSIVTNFDSNLKLNTNTNYYIAAVADIGATGASVTFFIKDLTAGTTLQTTAPVTDATVTGLYNSTANLTIGASYNNNTITRFFDGAMDEIRLSNVGLGESELLISSIPEPTTAALLIAGLALGVAVLRRPVRPARTHTPLRR